MKRTMIVLAGTLVFTGAAFAAENNSGTNSATGTAGTVTGVGSALSESKAAGPLSSSSSASDSSSNTGAASSQQMDRDGSRTTDKGAGGPAAKTGTAR